MGSLLGVPADYSRGNVSLARPDGAGHLGYIASVVGRKLKWDAENQKIVDDPEASKLLSRPMRAPWHL